MCSSHLRGFLLVIKEKILVSPAVACGLELFGVLTSNVLYYGKCTTSSGGVLVIVGLQHVLQHKYL